MRSFRLYVGEKKYLTAAGWVSVLLAVAAGSAVGYAYAGWLADRLGPGNWMIWIVAGVGMATWGVCWFMFRSAGFPLIADLPDEGSDPARRE